MPFYEGVANSLQDILAALRSGMMDSGWSATDHVLHKNGCQVQALISGSTLQVLGGGGREANGALATPGPAPVMVGTASALMSLSFPCAYHLAIHDDPDEVFLQIIYDVDKVQWLAFGKSALELPGAGVWYSASMQAAGVTGIYINPASGGSNGSTRGSVGLFNGAGGTGVTGANSFIHTDVDGVGWAPSTWTITGTSSVNKVFAADALAGLIDRLPSAFNGSSILLPVQVWQIRPANTVSMVADLGHARVLRIDDLLLGEIIELGSERWRVYPYFRKNAAERDGGTNIEHSGTMGFAVRYDGP